MDRNSASRILSTASFISFVGCLCFGAAALASDMRDDRLLLATLACLFWSYLASCRAEALAPTRGKAGFGLSTR